MPVQGMTPGDICELVEVGDPRLSPDRSQVAFVVTTIDGEANEYRSRVWVVAADGSSPPRALTSGDQRDARPRWSPDGTRLAFVSHRDDKGSQLYVLPMAGGGEVVKVATSPEEIDDLVWSPDGNRIAFGARARDEERYGKEKPKDQPPRRITRLFYRLDSVGWTVDRPRHLFVVDADGTGEPIQVTSGPWQDGGLAWTPDAASLVFASGRHDTWDLDRASDLFVVKAEIDAEPARVTRTGSTYGRPSPSADGTLIASAFGADPSLSPSNTQIVVTDVATGETTMLTESLDRNCASLVGAPREPAWVGDDIWFQAEDRGNVPLYRVAADGSGKPEVVLGAEQVVTGFDVRGGAVAYTAATATTLTELYVLDGDVARQLTSFGQAFLSGRRIAAPERFTATSSDGEEVDAWIMRPTRFKAGASYPAILNIHGGPFSQYANKLFDEFQIQAGAGYVVIYANPRGSSGYGEAAAQSIRGRTARVKPGTGWGGMDYDDLTAVVDEAVNRFPFIDADRLGVTGGSYGGYMTTWIAGHTDRFKAAASERACNDLIALDSACDIASAFRSWVGVDYLEDPDEWRRMSPITYVENITTPMLVLHSEEDLRCPIAQADALFTALRRLGREVEMVRFPGESHELSRSGSPTHRVQRMEIILDWFDRYLK